MRPIRPSNSTLPQSVVDQIQNNVEETPLYEMTFGVNHVSVFGMKQARKPRGCSCSKLEPIHRVTQ